MTGNWKTEEEAKQTWCPRVQVMGLTLRGETITTTNRCTIIRNGYEETCCIASECGMWVWAEESIRRVPDGCDVPEGYYVAGQSDLDGMITLRTIPRGGCGLRRVPS